MIREYPQISENMIAANLRFFAFAFIWTDLPEPANQPLTQNHCVKSHVNRVSSSTSRQSPYAGWNLPQRPGSARMWYHGLQRRIRDGRWSWMARLCTGYRQRIMPGTWNL